MACEALVKLIKEFSMVTTSNIIDARGAPYQPCWGCGKLAGGREQHLYYGNFKFGIECSDCSIRIKTIINRSFRALSALAEPNDDQTKEVVMQALITTTARKLKNRLLNTIENDNEIRVIVETEGMNAALAVFRAISKVDDITWESRLNVHKTIMEGPKVIEDVSIVDKNIIAETRRLIQLGIEKSNERHEKCLEALKRMTMQINRFSELVKAKKNETPYCILEEVISPYYHNIDDMDGLEVLLKTIDTGNLWKVLFLARECRDGSYSYITHVIVDHIALLPAETLFDKAKSTWQAKCGNQENFKPVVFPLSCLNWKHHWVLIKEIGIRLSVGEGAQIRPSAL